MAASLGNGIEGRLGINKRKLHDDVVRVVSSSDGFALVMEDEGKLVGCFMAEMVPHAYCNGNIVQELGVYITNEHRGGAYFTRMLEAYLGWASGKPDVLLTTFSIGQLGASTPYLRAVLKKHGFTKGDEGYYRL